MSVCKGKRGDVSHGQALVAAHALDGAVRFANIETRRRSNRQGSIGSEGQSGDSVVNWTPTIKSDARNPLISRDLAMSRVQKP